MHTITSRDTDDASQPAFVLLLGSGGTIAADSRTEIVEALIAGYDQIPHQPDGDADALYARHRTLVDVANVVQGSLVASMVDDGTIELESVPEEALTAALSPKDQAATLAVWQEDFALLIVATMYAPYTDVALPKPGRGEVVVLDPSTETSFLKSFVTVGMAELMENRDGLEVG